RKRSMPREPDARSEDALERQGSPPASRVGLPCSSVLQAHSRTRHAYVIVVGSGGVGSAVLYHLARRGVRALGIDRFPGGHDRGSSHGHSRIIRLAYFEHPDYVPLLRRSYELWSELEQRRRQQLFFPVGLLEIGPPNGIVVPGVLASARQHNLS